MKYLVIWELVPAQLRPETVQAVMLMPDYAKNLFEKGKLVGRYHIVGKHGGAWIFDVDSNEEMERMLAMAPVYNQAVYNVYPLAEMESPSEVLHP